MSNRIVRVEVVDRVLTPARAELLLRVAVARRSATTELRGRWTGPYCAYASTVQVSYALHPIASDDAVFAARIVIPEPLFWSPTTPFLYRGALELWEDGCRCDEATFAHGLRALALGPRGLQLNGWPIELNGRRVRECTDEHARQLRKEGCNLLLAPASLEHASLWALADQYGFFVIGEVPNVNTGEEALIDALARHPSSLGWLIASGTADGAGPSTASPVKRRSLLGMACAKLDDLPSELDFALLPEPNQDEATGAKRAWLLEAPREKAGAGSARLLGRVE